MTSLRQELGEDQPPAARRPDEPAEIEPALPPGPSFAFPELVVVTGTVLDDGWDHRGCQVVIEWVESDSNGSAEGEPTTRERIAVSVTSYEPFRFEVEGLGERPRCWIERNGTRCSAVIDLIRAVFRARRANETGRLEIDLGRIHAGRGYEVVVHVSDQLGRPVPGAIVGLISPSQQAGIRRAPRAGVLFKKTHLGRTSSSGVLRAVIPSVDADGYLAALSGEGTGLIAIGQERCLTGDEVLAVELSPWVPIQAMATVSGIPAAGSVLRFDADGQEPSLLQTAAFEWGAEVTASALIYGGFDADGLATILVPHPGDEGGVLYVSRDDLITAKRQLNGREVLERKLHEFDLEPAAFMADGARIHLFDPAKKPVSGARCLVDGAVWREVRAGEYAPTLPLPSRGTHVVQASHSEHPTSRWVVHEEDFYPLSRTLKRKSPLTVTVLDDSRRPVSNAVVRLRIAGGHSVPLPAVTTGTDGKARFPMAPPVGRRSLWVSMPSPRASWLDTPAILDARREIVVPIGVDEHEVVWPRSNSPAGALSIAATSADGGLPVLLRAGRLRPYGGRENTDALSAEGVLSGDRVFYRSVEAGTYVAWLSDGQGRSGTCHVEVVAGIRVEAFCELDTPKCIAGFVIFGDGQSVPRGAMVAARLNGIDHDSGVGSGAIGWETSPRSPVGSDGSFCIENVTSGVYDLAVTYPVSDTVPTLVNTRTDELDNLLLEVEPTTGFLISFAGALHRESRIRATRESETGPPTTARRVLAAEGEDPPPVFLELDAGNWLVILESVDASGYWVEVSSVRRELSDGESIRLDL